jgi:putative protease
MIKENFMNKPELLSPAGNFECVRAAAENGCDAVYIGGKDFSARHFAGNFDIDEIEKTVDYCHLRGVKVYCTINTLYKNQELNDVVKYADRLSAIGVDALIVQDIGLADLIKKSIDIPIHASTQLTANSLADVNAFYGMGFSRVVLSRELSLDEIEFITKKHRGRNRNVYTWCSLCFLFRSVHNEQYAWRKKRKQGKMCADMQASILSL